ncbi:MAG TPA: hypothetical protein VFJ82_04590 [Longimicrobium sp.]|nr:hypothetical protein [Longimicrobium sp.]
MNIQQFHAALTAGGRADGAARAYRELARRPDVARGARFSDWLQWTARDGRAVRAS